MFLVHQPTIQNFRSQFEQDSDGNVFFSPEGETLAMPVSLDSYFELVENFERNHRIGMGLMWLSVLAGGLFGMYEYIVTDKISEFFLYYGAGMAVGALCLLHGNLRVPFWLGKEFLAWKAQQGVIAAAEDAQRGANP